MSDLWNQVKMQFKDFPAEIRDRIQAEQQAGSNRGSSSQRTNLFYRKSDTGFARSQCPKRSDCRITTKALGFTAKRGK